MCVCVCVCVGMMGCDSVLVFMCSGSHVCAYMVLTNVSVMCAYMVLTNVSLMCVAINGINVCVNNGYVSHLRNILMS